MRRTTLVQLTTGLVIAALGWGRPAGAQSAAALMFKPDHSFAEEKTAPAPDYTADAAWAELPGGDAAASGSAATPVNVFFLYPTTYLSKASWNSAFDDPGKGVGGGGVDGTLRNQASAFAKCCRIFAPRYRQATLFAFLDTSGDGVKAIDLAYHDVERAFAEFIDHRNGGKPFIAAAHSQGSIHLLRLIQQKIAGTPLQKLLIALYPIGAAVPADFNVIPPCNDAAQTGCLVTWNAVSDPHYDRSRGGTVPIWLNGHYETVGSRRLMCINPLDWHVNGAAPASADLGSMPPIGLGGQPVFKEGYVSAKCIDGELVVDLPSERPDFKMAFGGPGSLHIYDYNLFYVNLQENAVARAAAWLAHH